MGTASDDVYAQLMTEHMRSLQADDGRRNAQATTGQRRQGDMAAAGGQSMPGPWQDPQIHLLSLLVSLRARITMWSILSVKKPSRRKLLRGVTTANISWLSRGLSQRSKQFSGPLLISHSLLGEGKLLDQGVIDYLSYTTKVYS